MKPDLPSIQHKNQVIFSWKQGWILFGVLMILLSGVSCFSTMSKGYLRFDIDDEQELAPQLNIDIGTTTRDGVIVSLGEPDFRYESGDDEWLIYHGTYSIQIVGIGPVKFRKLVVKCHQNIVESVEEYENGKGFAVFSYVSE